MALAPDSALGYSLFASWLRFLSDLPLTSRRSHAGSFALCGSLSGIDPSVNLGIQPPDGHAVP
jgi:hypothetical protein